MSVEEVKRLTQSMRKAKELGSNRAYHTLFVRWRDAFRALTLDEFREAGLVVPILSSVLGDTVYFVSGQAEAQRVWREGGVPYTAEELQSLLDRSVSEEELCRVHEVKKSMLGIVMPSEAPRSRPDVKDSLVRLAKRIASCGDCQLCEGRRKAVLGEGPPDARIIFVGEAPGGAEDKTGRPFIGPAGQVLNRVLNQVGIDRNLLWIGNTVKCRPPGNREPTEEEVSACRKYLKQQLLLIRPDVIVTLGRHALRWFLPDASVEMNRGMEQQVDGYTIFPTYHPAAVLYRPEVEFKIKEDLQFFAKRWVDKP